MNQYMLGTHRHAMMKRYLEPELKNFKKKTLTTICDTLNLYQTSNNKKERQIDSIVQKFCEMLNNGKKNGVAEDAVIDSILGRINHPEQLFPQILRKALLSYLDYVKVQTIQQPQMFVQMKRPVGVAVEDLKQSRQCLCRGDVNSPNVVPCSVCFREYHRECIHIPMGELFECPFCFMQDMDPIHQVIEPLFIGYLRTEDNIHNLRFYVKESDLAQPRNQVQLRCVRLDGKNNYELTWPDYGYVKVNENKLADLKPLINNSSLKRRKDQAKLVERRILRTNGENTAQVTVMPPQLKQQVRISITNHLVGIYLIKVNTPADVMANMKGNIITEQESRQILLEQMSPVDDITIERLDVSLECVFSMEPIRIPARSRQCRHFNCFDLSMMISTINKSQPRRWRCPICKKKAHRLCVDPTLLAIIQEHEPKRLSEVAFLPDLSYKVIQQKVETDREDSQPERPAKPTGPIICLDDEQDNLNVERVVSNNPPGLIEHSQDNIHEGLSFEPNPFMIEENLQTFDKLPNREMEVEKEPRENGSAMVAEQPLASPPAKDNPSPIIQEPPAASSSDSQSKSLYKKLPSAQLERLNDQAIATMTAERARVMREMSNSQAEIVTTQLREHQKSAESRSLKASRPGPEPSSIPDFEKKKQQMPFEIITSPGHQATQMPYPPMKNPYVLPPSHSGMNMIPNSSRYPPQSKGGMYPPYPPVHPYYNFYPGAVQRSRYEDPSSMYMPMMPDYPPEYPMHPMRGMPHLNHLQHIQQMMNMGQFNQPLVPPGEAAQLRNYHPPMPHPSQSNVKYPPQVPLKFTPNNLSTAKLSQSAVSSPAGNIVMQKKPSVPEVKPPAERPLPPPYTKPIQMRSPQPIIQRGMPVKHLLEPTSVSSKPKEVIEIVDSEEQVEEQKKEQQRAHEQWAKLNQLNLMSLQSPVAITDKERESLLEILESYESTK